MYLASVDEIKRRVERKASTRGGEMRGLEAGRRFCSRRVGIWRREETSTKIRTRDEHAAGMISAREILWVVHTTLPIV